MNDIRKVLSYNDVLLVPRHSGLEHIKDAHLEYQYGEWRGEKISRVPLINAPMNSICTPELLNKLHDEYNMPVTIHRWFNNATEQLDYFMKCRFNPDNFRGDIFLSVGALQKHKEWIDELIARNCPLLRPMYGILVDMANGDTKACVETVEYIRSKRPDILIMAGNIATKSGFRRLEEAGANFIRVGIGGGSICSTRTQVGFGVPVLASIFDCAGVKNKAFLVADGGIETPGDIVKAMAAGADMVMMGKMFAGTSLSNGTKYDKDFELTEDNSKVKYMSYHGLASLEAIKSLKTNVGKNIYSVEGVSGLVPYKGDTDTVVKGILGNLQCALSYYAGCENWEEFQRSAKFIEITSSGLEENKTRVIQRG